MDQDLIGLDSDIGGKLNKFKVRELNKPQRLSFVWWPAMETVEYSGEMSVDLLIETYRKYVSDKGKTFYSPVFLDRYQAYVPNLGYIHFRTPEEVAEAVKVFDDLKMQAPKFQRKASTFVVDWPISKNGMKSQYSTILEDDWEVEVLYLSLTEKNYRQIRQLHGMGKSFTENDIIATCAEGPLNYQKWTPVDISGSTFCTLIQLVEKSDDERSRAARKILSDILKIVGNKAKPAKNVLLEQLGASMSTTQIKSKLTAGSAVNPSLAQAIEETTNSMDVDAMLASMDED